MSDSFSLSSSSSSGSLVRTVVNEACGQTLYSGKKGRFASPEYPNNYRSDLHCDYRISVPKRFAIHLMFTIFALEDPTPNGCEKDYVEVYDGTTIAKNLLATSCGTYTPKDVSSYGDFIILRFVTSSSVQKQGFKVTWTAIPAPIDHRDCGERPLARIRGHTTGSHGGRATRRMKAQSDGSLVRKARRKRSEIANVKRIVGGLTARSHSWEWVCEYGHEVHCAGTLIRNRAGDYYLLTTDDCLGIRTHIYDERVYCGEDHDRYNTEFAVVRKIKYDEYNPRRPHQDNIALLKLGPPEQEDPRRDPPQGACFPRDNVHSGFVYENGGVALGWGSLGNGQYPDKLQQVDVDFLDEGACGYWSYFNESIHLCAGSSHDSHGPCVGDSGGPLLTERNHKWTLTGIVSYGNTSHCGQADYPGVYMDVFAYHTWVDQVINEGTQTA